MESKMNELLQFIKGLIRPVIIIWGLGVYTACLFSDVAMPQLIMALVGAVAGEYAIERAVKRIREK